MAWVGETPAAPLDDSAVMQEVDAWRQQLEARGVLVLGGGLGGPETATTLRFDDGELKLSTGPFLDSKDLIASIDVASCAGRQQAIKLAAEDPFAGYHAIEVRPFHSG